MKICKIETGGAEGASLHGLIISLLDQSTFLNLTDSEKYGGDNFLDLDLDSGKKMNISNLLFLRAFLSIS